MAAARSSIRTLARALVPAIGKLSGDERDAVNALALHLLRRFEQDRFAPLDADGRTFLTVRHMQRLLRGVGARCMGEKAAREAINYLCANGILEDTGEVKKPRQRPNRIAAREKFEHQPSTPNRSNYTGGRDAQPTLLRSYWWRVFRVVPLSAVLRTYGAMRGAYAYISDVPQHLASLSAWAGRQGLISRSRGRRRARPGSVQWVFAHSGLHERAVALPRPEWKAVARLRHARLTRTLRTFGPLVDTAITAI